MKLLMHICCGPCATYPTKILQQDDDIELYGLFFNPNIQPYTEYSKRMETARQFAQAAGLKLITVDEYNLVEFLRNAAFRESMRCRMCYAMRLERAASVARNGGFDAFTTTMLVSPYQKHEWVKEIGREAGEKYGVPFLYRDFREGYKEGVEISKAMGLYRQQYCGCIYSEMERYISKKKGELYK
ncbi:MAG: epoxyqueuosine reductase [Clostridiales bacterium]|uniref:Epoxyqueuosine reductase QueH n=1 Tax=Mahella australiensis (strain DSM 15567 / CIP 107919 / 50-1 BON) TaxID=697281 RepID=F4A1F4_MAHA5|nr:epoxyqueuosine reductase QueH [Mahella australiensis]AEE97073.1 protein of unknown function DUF208 [Mahella australiensis 50-1 BON]MDK2991705.1 epoxyqueuosine reductase [Clostridiales bacterium]